jgi:hypothetical protein
MFGWFRDKTPRQQASPDEVVRRALELQQAYWTFDLEEKNALLQRRAEAPDQQDEPDGLSWPERLRLHHLACLEMLGDQPLDGLQAQPADAETTALVEELAWALLGPQSPYRPRLALVFQGEGELEEGDTPDQQGLLLNPALTHLGALEVIRVDEQVMPVEIDFVPMDALHAVVLPRPPSLLRVAQLLYEDQRVEMVLLPLLYGLSWRSGQATDTDGSMTRFLGHVELGDQAPSPGHFAPGSLGVGIGHQDLVVHSDEGQNLFGLGSVRHIEFPLDISDPHFDERCRARGLDPEQIRRAHTPEGN